VKCFVGAAGALSLNPAINAIQDSIDPRIGARQSVTEHSDLKYSDRKRGIKTSTKSNGISGIRLLEQVAVEKFRECIIMPNVHNIAVDARLESTTGKRDIRFMP